jgi:tetratricopeptide (TPR) repeat protein
MIDNFNSLILRCQARRRKKIIRTLLNIIILLILILTSIVVFIQFYYLKKPTYIASKTVIPTVTMKYDTNLSQSSLPIPSVIITDVNATKIQSFPKHPTVILHPVSIVSIPQQSLPTKITPQPIPAKTNQNSLFEVSSPSKALSTMTPQELFDTSPKYETALLNARELYAKNNFVDAAIWAKKANQMNREAEEAWLLYAKSYYAQGRKNEAMDVLMLYLNYKESKTAQELLRTWKSTQ